MKNNFDRSLWPLLGLPIDALGMDDAVREVCLAIQEQRPLFLSTPNLNWVVSAYSDPDFRRSVLNSDLCLADGMPLIWIARLLNMPVKERVAGSGLIEAMMTSGLCKQRPVKVFFFGGDEGVAEIACRKLQQDPGGLTAVGSYYPGFGSVEEMSQKHIIEKINQSGAEFIIVSLGARKGQEWIERNRHQLHAPVISHLGAVVNFVAGTAKRAPAIYQRLGLEWLWRIKEEPGLWKRYFNDGLKLISLSFTRVLPFLVFNFRYRGMRNHPQVVIDVSNSVEALRISLKGIVTADNLGLVQEKIQEFPESSHIVIDLTGLEFIDASFIGLLFLLYKYADGNLEIQHPSLRVRQVFKYSCAEFLLS